MHIQVIKNTKFSISSYNKTNITINEQKYSQSLFITSANIYNVTKSIADIDSLSISDLPELEAVELILIGGHNLNPLSMPKSFHQALSTNNISVEIMPTGAACRTFNLLLTEGREVGCLILL